MAMAARLMATATRRAKGNGNGNGHKKGDGDWRQQHGQWLWQRGWQASDGSNNGNGDTDGTKDMASHAMAGERGVMVAMGHGLCVCVLCVWRDHEKKGWT
jgi:hypothetical protein